jgi:conflict system STAND superfamily ATPase/restriction endonuclease
MGHPAMEIRNHIEYVQGAAVTLYDFKQLSPADFEELTRDLLQEHWKLRLEDFKNGRDKGIDLRYAAVPNDTIIIQCKHFASSSATKLIQHLRTEEHSKVSRLNPSRYVLVTSLPLNPSDKDKIQLALQPYIRTTHDILGADDVNNLIKMFPAVENKHFKLWMSSMAVLQRVLHNAAHIQTEFDVERVRRAIPLYVQTSNYNRALKILEESRFVIISGVPGIGKTTLADMLLFAHLESGYRPIVIKSDLSEAKELFDKEAAQVFYFDDFLGETFLGNRFDFLGKKEDSAILNFIDMVVRSKGVRLILTTREHILRHAYQISEHFGRQKGGLTERQCILQLSDYSLLDRGRILYNHIYFSNLPQPYKYELLRNGYYMHILKHRNVNPRLIEWLSLFIDTRNFTPTDYIQEINRVLENPEQLWRIAFEQQISDSSRSLLLALYSLGGKADLEKLAIAWRLLHQHRARKYNWKMAPEDLRRSLQDLEGGFLRFELRQAVFVNPSVKDFLDSRLTCDLDNLEDLLTTARTFEQIVSIWSLAQSDKGALLHARFRQSPEQLMAAVNLNLNNPYEQKSIEVEHGGRVVRDTDVRPEMRMRTMLSIAEETKLTTTLQLAGSYVQKVVAFWIKSIPDFEATIEIFRFLDKSVKWDQENADAIYQGLKGALLLELADFADSVDLLKVVDYVGDRHQHWTHEDRQLVIRAFDEYLGRGFDEEISNYYAEDELADFSRRIESIGYWCNIDTSSYENQIAEQIAELEPPEHDEVEPVKRWETSERYMPEYVQEAEVRRMFDGLQTNII